MKMYVYLFLLTFLSISLTSCSDKEEEKMVVGNEKVKIVFNEDGEPGFNPSIAIDEQFLSQHLGRVTVLSHFYYIRSNVSKDDSSMAPSKLYGILNPNLYLKDKDTLVIFRQEDGVITQYVKKRITIDMENSVIRSDGKFVAQLRSTMAFPGRWAQGLFYYGKQEGEDLYVYVHVGEWRNVNLPDGLDKL